MTHAPPRKSKNTEFFFLWNYSLRVKKQYKLKFPHYVSIMLSLIHI